MDRSFGERRPMARWISSSSSRREAAWEGSSVVSSRGSKARPAGADRVAHGVEGASRRALERRLRSIEALTAMR
jgi:hypothetical protein